MAAVPPVTAPVQTIDINEAGRVLATLNDWRSIMFAELVVIGVLVLLLCAMVGVIVWMANRRSANDQATLQVLKESIAANVDQAASIRAMETIVSRLEAHLPELPT